LDNVSAEQLLAKDSLGRGVLHYACAYCTQGQIEDLLKRLPQSNNWVDNDGLEPYQLASSMDAFVTILEWMTGETPDQSQLLQAGFLPSWMKLAAMSRDKKQQLQSWFLSEEFASCLENIEERLEKAQGPLALFNDDFLISWSKRVVSRIGLLMIFAKTILGRQSQQVLQMERLRNRCGWLGIENSFEASSSSSDELVCGEVPPDMYRHNNHRAFLLADRFWEEGEYPSLTKKQIQPFRYQIFQKLKKDQSQLESLLQRGFDVNAVDMDGQTALAHILDDCAQSKMVMVDVWRALLERTEPELLKFKGRCQQTPLFSAYIVVSASKSSEALSFFKELLHCLPYDFSLRDSVYDKQLPQMAQGAISELLKNWLRGRDMHSPSG